MDPRRLNGGPFLGLNGIAIKSHGGTDALGFASAIEVGYEMAREQRRSSVWRRPEAFGSRARQADGESDAVAQVEQAHPRRHGAASVLSEHEVRAWQSSDP